MKNPFHLLCISSEPELENALRAELTPFGDAVTLTQIAPGAPQLREAAAAADGVLCGAFPAALRAAATHLQWVQFWSAGVDNRLYPELFADGVIVCTGSGIHTASAAEHVLSLMLAFARGLPQSFAAQQARDWEGRRAILDSQFELEGKTVGIVGAGVIGQSIGVRCQAFGMKTVGTRRDPSKPTRGMDVLLSHIQYHDLILASDFIVLALPLTASTRMIFGEDEIEILRKGTYLFNIGRGDLIDARWVIKALQNRWLAGAGLDVFPEEPLPADSPFWTLPNCIITPHVGGNTPEYWPRFARLVAAQLTRLQHSDPLQNLVDKDLGY